MRTLIYYFICTLIIGNLSCKDDQTHELELKEKELALKQRELELKEKEARLNEPSESDNSIYEQAQTPKTVTKYMYVLIKTNEPELHQTVEEAPHPVSTGYFDEPRELPKYSTYTTNRYFNYASDIITISDYNEDKRYMEIEKFEKEINSKLSYVNSELRVNESVLGSSESTNASAMVLSRKSFVFDSYQEASEHKNRQ